MFSSFNVFILRLSIFFWKFKKFLKIFTVIISYRFQFFETFSIVCMNCSTKDAKKVSKNSRRKSRIYRPKFQYELINTIDVILQAEYVIVNEETKIIKP